MRASKMRYAILVILILVAVVGVVLYRLNEPMSATDEALGRGLVTGMSLTDATALLKRVGVPFTVDPQPDGTTIVKYGRKTESDRRTSSTSEQHLVFDAQGRLRDQMNVY